MSEIDNNSIIKSPLKAIKAYCIECSGNQINEVKKCPCTSCPLYAFRFGKNPYSTRTLTEEQRQRQAERMRQNLQKSKKE